MKDKFYYKDGTTSERLDLNKVLHRTDGPAVEWADGDKGWYVDGPLHRTDGPAVEYDDGTKFWWVNGKCHRIDGPAMEWVDGAKEWWVDNKFFLEEEFKALMEEIESLPKALRLIDPREWVRKVG